MSSKQPWERMQGEGVDVWVAFEHYRKLPIEERSLAKVARILKRSIRTIQHHSRKYKWTERAAAWDTHKAALGDAADIAESERIRREHAIQLAKVRAAAISKLEKLSETGDLSERGAVKLFLETVKLERLVVGDTTERVEVKGELDLSALSAEDIRRLREIKSRLGGGGA